MIQVAFIVFCLLQVAHSSPKCQEDSSDFHSSYEPHFENTLPEDHFCKEKTVTIYHRKPVHEYIHFEGKQPNVSTFIFEYPPTDAPPITSAIEDKDCSSPIAVKQSIIIGSTHSPPIIGEDGLETLPSDQLKTVSRNNEEHLIVPGSFMMLPMGMDDKNSLPTDSNDSEKNTDSAMSPTHVESFTTEDETTLPKFTDSPGTFPNLVVPMDSLSNPTVTEISHERSNNPEESAESDKSPGDGSVLPITMISLADKRIDDQLPSDQSASESETSLVTVPKLSNVCDFPLISHSIDYSTPYVTSPTAINIDKTSPFKFPTINTELHRYSLYSIFGQFLPSSKSYSLRVKPVYEDVICNIPVVKNVLKNRVVETTRHVPIVEKLVSHEHHKVIRHIPVVQKVRRNVVEYRTKHIPVVRHRTRVLEEPYTVHVTETQRITRPVIETVVKQVPVVVSHSKPVVHHRIRHVPIVETRYHPVIEETVTTVPIRKKIIKNVISDKVKSVIFPPLSLSPFHDFPTESDLDSVVSC